MQPEGIPLLRTKLDVPPRRAHTLPRERLLALIPSAAGDAPPCCSPRRPALERPPRLATWCHALIEQRGTAVAWLALDESDNDPARFLAYLVIEGLLPRTRPAPTPFSTAPNHARRETVMICLL